MFSFVWMKNDKNYRLRDQKALYKNKTTDPLFIRKEALKKKKSLSAEQQYQTHSFITGFSLLTQPWQKKKNVTLKRTDGLDDIFAVVCRAETVLGNCLIMHLAILNGKVQFFSSVSQCQNTYRHPRTVWKTNSHTIQSYPALHQHASPMWTHAK